MAQLCEHVLNLKVEKIANYFNKSPLRCTGNKKHSTGSQDICLTCGETRCQEFENLPCSYQHHYGTKHPMIYRIDQQEIFCFVCKTVLSPLLGENLSNKQEKVEDARSRIIQFGERMKDRQPVEIAVEPVKKKEKPAVEKTEQEEEEKMQQIEEKKESVKAPEGKGLKLGVFGLKNLGNTCFFNSSIQCLYATELLHIAYATFKLDLEAEFNKVGEISILFGKYLRNQEKFFIPKALFSWICRIKGQYKHMDQQDAQEVLGLLLNGLIDGQRFWLKHQGKQIPKRVKFTPTEKIFGFYIASRLECYGCQKVSWSIDFSLDIPVELARPNHKRINLPQGPIPANEIGEEGLVYPTGQDSGTFIDHFFAPQTFTKANYFTCEHCGSQKAFRKLYLKQPPLVLIVSLKRFNNNGSKNSTQIKLPPHLDLAGHVIDAGDHVYELFAMAEHSGTARGGHYVAYSKRGAEWLYFSDGMVKPMSWDRVRTSQPYILFYRRV